ncbi:MAG: energy transducer TonB [Candidatus Thiosymbion ectosymbiont of Robbea hypermnestra]|nr:energy transducer TonB [Candidatus Thiosymbion ectosymbiont of Robbea hypermnestra]
MSNRRHLLVAGAISAGLHVLAAFVVTATYLWIDPPRLDSPSEQRQLQVTFAPMAAAVAEPEVPARPPERPADAEPVAPAQDGAAEPPVPTAEAPPETPTPRAKADRAEPEPVGPVAPDVRAAELILNRNTTPRKELISPPKANRKPKRVSKETSRKTSKKAPKRAAAKPKSKSRTQKKKSAKNRPPKRARANNRRPAKTESRKSAARKRKSAKAGAGSRADSRRVRKPTPSYRPRPKYPGIARRRGQEGTVILKVLVDTRGQVGSLQVQKSSGHRILDQQAMKTVRKWTFKPGNRGGRPSRMWVRVPIRFQLK